VLKASVVKKRHWL